MTLSAPVCSAPFEEGAKQGWDQLLGAYPGGVQDIAPHARRLIFSEIPNILETVDAKAKVVGYGFGTGYADMICTIILSKTGGEARRRRRRQLARS